MIPPTPVSLEDYHSRRADISLLMSHFLLPYLLTISHEFKGDLAMVIVLGEIGHHNLSGHFGPRGLAEGTAAEFDENPGFRERLPACNAFSLAAATGLPRETVRRKIATLEKRGWLERTPNRCFRLTPKVAAHFFPDTNYHLMLPLLATAGRIQALLQKDPS